MKLEAAEVEGFRSLEEVRIPSCGGFNVLIGKNNAGKSNILLAIRHFFECVHGGDPVSISTAIGRPVDFNEDIQADRIAITVTFRLSKDDRKDLVSDVVAVAPQVKKTIEPVDPNLRLQVRLEVPKSERRFSCIKKISLVAPKDAERGEYESVRVLLSVPDEAATELARRAQKISEETNGIHLIDDVVDGLRRVDASDWEMFRTERRPPLGYLTRRARLPHRSPQHERTIEDLMRGAESKGEFRDALGTLAEDLRGNIERLRAEPLSEAVDAVAGEDTRIPAYVKDVLETIASIKVLHLKERREPIGPDEANQLLELKIRRGGPEKLRDIQETVEGLLGVEIDAFRSEKESRPGSPNAELDVDRFLVQVNGAGIREALRLILDYEFEQPDILLVEEPEIHLHPALEISMMEYLRRRGKDSQIFITTHSTNFLDTADMRNIYLVSNPRNTVVEHIDLERAETVIPQELGIRLSSVFMYDRLVFVEGKSDEEIIRELARTFHVNLARANVGFIPMEGIRNISHYAQKRTISFLTRRNVDIFFIVDRDEKNSAEVKELAERIGDRAELLVLSRRELENYLLVPRAIGEFLQGRREAAGSDEPVPDHDELEEALHEAAEELKQLAVNLRVIRRLGHPIYLSRTGAKEATSDEELRESILAEIAAARDSLDEREREVKDVIREERRRVEADWDRKKLDVVPGSSLIDETCKQFGVRYEKVRDGSRMARSLRSEEVAAELKTILESLGRVS